MVCKHHFGRSEVSWKWSFNIDMPPQPPQTFYGPFPGPPGWAGARRELLDFMVQGKINRGRHTDHPAGRHSIRTNQCPPPPSPIFLHARCPSCRPTNCVKALKAKLHPDLIFCSPITQHHNNCHSYMGVQKVDSSVNGNCTRPCAPCGSQGCK